MCTERFLGGFVIGAAVGGVLGLLLAPSSGEETREKILDKTEEVYKHSEDSLKEIQTKANDVMDNIQKKGDDLFNKVQDLIKQQRGEA